MLVIIVVNYKNELMTVDYVRNELSKVCMPHKVIIVNNAATPSSDSLLCTALQAELVYDIRLPVNKELQYFVLSHSENLGFARGNNLGAEFSIGHFQIDTILFSNNDIRFVDDDVVERLTAKLMSMSDLGVIGPKVVGLKGECQSPEPYYSFCLRYFLRYWLTPFLSQKRANRLMKFGYSETAKEGKHYKVMGSFFLVKTKDFVDCGMMDPNTFLYSEEVILSERMKRIGRSIYYYPKVSVVHEHGATISKNANAKRMRRLQFMSESYYYKEYRNTPQFVVWLGSLSLWFYNMLKEFSK